MGLVKRDPSSIYEYLQSGKDGTNRAGGSGDESPMT